MGKRDRTGENVCKYERVRRLHSERLQLRRRRRPPAPLTNSDATEQIGHWHDGPAMYLMLEDRSQLVKYSHRIIKYVSNIAREVTRVPAADSELDHIVRIFPE
ncbi:unnamed protein product [Pieris macdunnoughi]|uniref:Uncharacterized protein n=1 Tax=Pieris macdunnoughi TaxID=345717 RepID=A0A821S601_9NEOP|nr:unnamed protein product [Pieris macdunnoughi]